MGRTIVAVLLLWLGLAISATRLAELGGITEDEVVSLEDEETKFVGRRKFVTEKDVKEADDFLQRSSIARNVLGVFGHMTGGALKFWRLVPEFKKAWKRGGFASSLSVVRMQIIGSSWVFPYFNFVQGFGPEGGFKGALHKLRRKQPKWRPPVKGERMGIITYNDYARKYFGRSFPADFFNYYYTGEHIPSWEDNVRHKKGTRRLAAAYRLVKIFMEPMHFFRQMEPRVAFDNELLTRIPWKGFKWMGPHDIKYASNGAYGISVVDSLLSRFNTKDTLGVLMTESVFSYHLKYHDNDASFHLDLSAIDRYAPIPGYAPLGGQARFGFANGRLVTKEIIYKGKTYSPSEDDEEESNRAFKQSRLVGWRYAEKAVIASLLSMTNLVLHVKDLHLELAAAFQVISVDAFADMPTNPVRRMLEPFVHRACQATNDNFKLLFQMRAAEFSLAPLPYDEQLRLMDDAIKEQPLVLADLDLERLGLLRGMPPAFSQKDAQTDNEVWFWRWHYRALTVQRLYDQMIKCWIEANYGTGAEAEAALEEDEMAQVWWQSMIEHLPAVKRATEQYPEWADPAVLTTTTLRHVTRTLFVWLSWVHEDVGHAAAAYVYNPVHTPMAVPEDGEGVPLSSWAFNSLAYRGFVFLNRAKLLETAPEHWFDKSRDDTQCFVNFQEALRELGRSDKAFSECDKEGFYSCVERVETGVSS